MLTLCLLWICWCVMHSLLIDISVEEFLCKQLSGIDRYYRFIYNALSVVSIAPLIYLARSADGHVIYSWQGYYNCIRIAMVALALYLFTGGAKLYNFSSFLGVKQFRSGRKSQLLSDNEGFSEQGVFGLVRHPWYLGSLLFIWAVLPVYRSSEFIVSSILSCYLIIGTLLEERKLDKLYGAKYQIYRQRVAMFFPWRWLLRLFGVS